MNADKSQNVSGWSPLDRVAALFGADVFFVPCIWGTKIPAVTYTQRPFEATQTPAYRAALASGEFNIAVYLGQMSGGLCALDFDQDEDLAAFLAVNPLLATTTRSRGSRGGMVWLRVTDEFPASCTTKHFEWRANGRLSTIHGLHPKGMEYTMLVEAAPVAVPFAEVQWPDGWDLPWVGAAAREAAEALAREYGQPFYTNKDGKVNGINERYWAALYARENRVLFDPDEKTFYRYAAETGLWETITPDSIRETISRRILEASREAQQFTLEIQITQNKLKAVVGALMGIAEKRGAFRAKDRFIHVANGVIRLGDDGDVKFGGYAPEDYSRNKSPFSFDGEAECPRFLNELIYPAVSADDADLLQRWAGLALFGYNLPQRFLILDGTPNGGKGTLVRIIQALVGIENTYQLRTECLNERFETYRYRGKTLLIGPDVAGDFLMQKGASMLKVLVGGDPISGEGKGLNGDFPMFGTFNMVMTCNSRLRIRLEGDAGAWRRRLLIVRYEKPAPAKRILDLHVPLLRDEGSGILRWALAGFVKLQTEFAELGDFMLTDAQRGRIDSLLAESDSLRLFVRDGLERHEYGDVTTGEFQQAYAEFCADKGWNALPITVVERLAADVMLDVWQVAKNHCIERDGKKSNRGWKRVKLRDASGPELGLRGET
jgi:P4 family phage/plasmid primase-like protien